MWNIACSTDINIGNFAYKNTSWIAVTNNQTVDSITNFENMHLVSSIDFPTLLNLLFRKARLYINKTA